MFINQYAFHPFPLMGVKLDKLNTQEISLSSNNLLLKSVNLSDTPTFQAIIHKLQKGMPFAIGGYLENREVYSQSAVFQNQQSSRSLHLGIDIWTQAFAPVYAPIDGKVHSFKNNNNFGDYGATLILEHEIENQIFYTLYGHLSLNSINHLYCGQTIRRGEWLCELGPPEENGHWPPHLHFQLIADLQGMQGDYPGVAFPHERAFYEKNCPNPMILIA